MYMVCLLHLTPTSPQLSQTLLISIFGSLQRNFPSLRETRGSPLPYSRGHLAAPVPPSKPLR